MIDCMVLERPGRWRSIALAVLLTFVLAPMLPFLGQAFPWAGSWSLGGPSFARAMGNSLTVAMTVAAAAFILGLPIGVLNSIYDYRGRRLLMGLALLPLLTPAFLWPVGWRWLFEHFGRSLLPLITGYSGCLMMFLPAATALVTFTTGASTASLSESNLEAARLAGGERTLFWSACRHAATPAALAAAFSGVLTLSDPGAGFAVGLPLASSEILISFTAFYDYALAGRQCLALTLLVLAAATPIAALAAPRLVAESTGRPQRQKRFALHPWMQFLAAAVLATQVTSMTLLPSFGLVLPLRRWDDLTRACAGLGHEVVNTVSYAAGAGFVSAALALALACCVGREPRLRRIAVAVCLTVFAAPPMLLALGYIREVALLPTWADPVLRGRAGVCLVLGMRFFPIAAFLALRSWSSMSPALAQAAGVHGVPLFRYLWTVLIPLQRRAALTMVLLTGLLATAEIGVILLLYPPGDESLTLHIFQMIGYPSPSSRLAALCAVDLGMALGLLAASDILYRGGRT